MPHAPRTPSPATLPAARRILLAVIVLGITGTACSTTSRTQAPLPSPSALRDLNAVQGDFGERLRAAAPSSWHLIDFGTHQDPTPLTLRLRPTRPGTERLALSCTGTGKLTVDITPDTKTSDAIHTTLPCGETIGYARLDSPGNATLRPEDPTSQITWATLHTPARPWPSENDNTYGKSPISGLRLPVVPARY